jgi:multidrug efflux pump subunit AcrA (membrane-fusion protein)
MKIISYSSAVLMGALCLTFGSVASAAEQKTAPAKNKASGKSTVVAQPAHQPDVVVWVKVTGSLIPQRYIIRDGRILNTGSNTQILLFNELTTTPSTNVGNILVANVPDISFRR